LIAIFSEGGLLRAETLRFAAEVRSSADVRLPKAVRPEHRVLDKVRRAVAGLEQKKLGVSELSDPHEPLRKLAEKKFRLERDVVRNTASRAKGGGADSGGQVIDLMEVLRQSLAQSGLTKKGSPKKGSPKKGSPKKGTRRASSQRKRALHA